MTFDVFGTVVDWHGLGAGNWNLLWALADIALGALVQGPRTKRAAAPRGFAQIRLQW